MSPTNRRFLVGAVCVGLAGGWAGFALSCLPKIAPHKLLNIVGILYGLLGVIVLAEIVVKSEALKRVMVTYVAGYALWASMLIPLGMIIREHCGRHGDGFCASGALQPLPGLAGLWRGLRDPGRQGPAVGRGQHQVDRKEHDNSTEQDRHGCGPR